MKKFIVIPFIAFFSMSLCAMEDSKALKLKLAFTGCNIAKINTPKKPFRVQQLLSILRDYLHPLGKGPQDVEITTTQGIQIKTKNSQPNNEKFNHIQAMEELIKKSPEIFLRFSHEPNLLHPLRFSYRLFNQKLAVSEKNQNNHKHQQALLAAIQFLFANLPKNEFNVTFIEQVLSGDYSNRHTIFIPEDKHKQFVTSTIHHNANCSRTILVPQILYRDPKEPSAILTVISPLLDSLKNNATKSAYKNALWDFAKSLLGPVINKQGERNINIDTFISYFTEAQKQKAKQQKLWTIN